MCDRLRAHIGMAVATVVGKNAMGGVHCGTALELDPSLGGKLTAENASRRQRKERVVALRMRLESGSEREDV